MVLLREDYIDSAIIFGFKSTFKNFNLDVHNCTDEVFFSTIKRHVLGQEKTSQEEIQALNIVYKFKDQTAITNFKVDVAKIYLLNKPANGYDANEELLFVEAVLNRFKKKPDYNVPLDVTSQLLAQYVRKCKPKTCDELLEAFDKQFRDVIMFAYNIEEALKANKRSAEDKVLALPAPKKVKRSNIAEKMGKLCDGCGWKNHLRHQCPAIKLPGFNPTGRWVGSARGNAYKALGADRLMCHKRPDGSPCDWREIITDEGERKKVVQTYYGGKDLRKDKVVALVRTRCNLIPMKLSVGDTGYGRVVYVLVDTGAASGNYISIKLRKWFDSHGNIFPENRTVVSGLADLEAVVATEAANFDLEVTDDNGVSFMIPDIFAAFINLEKIDIIIGINSIAENDLLKKLNNSILNGCDVNEEIFEDEYEKLIDEENFKSEYRWDKHFGAFQARDEYELLSLSQKADILDISDESIEILEEVEENYIDIDDKNNTNFFISFINNKDMEPQLRGPIQEVCKEFRDIFSDQVEKTPAKVPPMDLKVNAGEWEKQRNCTPPRPQSPIVYYETKRQVDALLESNAIRRSSAKYYSQVVMVPKKEANKYRMCIDLRALNDATINADISPLPNIKTMLDMIGVQGANIFGVIDLTSGYHQFPLKEEEKHLTAFITLFGKFEWNRLTMGLKGAGPYFQRIMSDVVLAGLVGNTCLVYMDDILIFAKNEHDFVDRTKEIFERFRKFQIFINPAKCRLGVKKVEYVGHVIENNSYTFSDARKGKAIDFVKPSTKKELQSFIGFVNYMGSHIRNITEIMAPMRDLIKHEAAAKAKIVWSAEGLRSFSAIKEGIRKITPLYFIDSKLPIRVYTDASSRGIGGYLCQVDSNGNELPIAFISKALSDVQKRWSTIELECYAIYYCLNKWDYLLRDNRFTLFTDHANLLYMNNSASHKVGRWKLAIQAYDFDLVYIEGPMNIIADLLSRNFEGVVTPGQWQDTVSAISRARRMDDSVRNKISNYHNDKVGHHGVSKTVLKLKLNDEKWEGMYHHVRKYIRECPTCQKLSKVLPKFYAERFVDSALAPMRLIAMDAIGPLPETVRGCKYILVIIDTFTRFIELVPIPNITAIDTAEALLYFVGRYGCPKEITSDRGSQFTNETIAEMLQILNIEHKLTMAYSKEENGVVERANKEVLRHIRAIILNKAIAKDWYIALPFVQRIINSSFHEAIGCSPATILFGKALNLDRNIVGQDRVDEQFKSITDYVAGLVKIQSDIIKIAAEHQDDIHKLHLSTEADELSSFRINEWVLASYHKTRFDINGDKFEPLMRGPMQIFEIGDKSSFQIWDPATGKYEWIHGSKLRKFEYSEPTNPVDIAYNFAGKYIVERVVAHKGTPANRKNLKFKIHWKGYGDDHDSWVEWALLRDNYIVHEYLKANNMYHVIPQRFRNIDRDEDILTPEISEADSEEAVYIEETDVPKRKKQRRA